MKCAAHNTDANGVCSWCGRAVCPACAKPTAAGRFVCSDNCAAALAREAKAMELILQKSLQNTRASAFYSFLCAALSAAGAIGANYYMHVPFLIWFCAGCAVVFTASGTWYASIARKNRE
jgi:predicted nucleic acid-binding Zn ribbon protein